VQLGWGSYRFPVNGVTIDADVSQIFNDGGQEVARRFRWKVTGWLLVNGQTDCSQQMSALDSALSYPYQDLVLYQDNGQPSFNVLRNAPSISGTRCVRGPSFPSSVGAEYATQRYFEAEFEAEYVTNGSAVLLLRFREEVEIQPAGPIYKCLPALNAPAQRQLIYPLYPCRASQHGEAVGYLQYPPPLPPIWPLALAEPPKIRRRDPQRRGNGYSEFPVSWDYRYEYPFTLVGIPNRWLS